MQKKNNDNSQAQRSGRKQTENEEGTTTKQRNTKLDTAFCWFKLNWRACCMHSRSRVQEITPHHLFAGICVVSNKFSAERHTNEHRTITHSAWSDCNVARCPHLPLSLHATTACVWAVGCYCCFSYTNKYICRTISLNEMLFFLYYLVVWVCSGASFYLFSLLLKCELALFLFFIFVSVHDTLVFMSKIWMRWEVHAGFRYVNEMFLSSRIFCSCRCACARMCVSVLQTLRLWEREQTFDHFLWRNQRSWRKSSLVL